MMSDKKKLVPKDLSKINNKAAPNKTGNDKTPRMAVKKNVQMVNGKRVILMPLVRKLMMVTI